MRVGFGILCGYLIWALAWFVYAYGLKGQLSNPYVPEINLSNELVSPLSRGYWLGADLLGRSMLEVLSAGLVYSLTLSLIVTFITSAI